MQEMRFILVVLGGVAIAALLIHGIWSNRRDRQHPLKDKPLGRMDNKPRDPDDRFDSDGIGAVRLVNGAKRDEPVLRNHHERDSELRLTPVIAADDELEPMLEQEPITPVAAQHARVVDPVATPPIPEPPAAPYRKPAQVNRRTPVYRSRTAAPMKESVTELESTISTAEGQVERAQPSIGSEQVKKSSRVVYNTEPDVDPLFNEPIIKTWQDVYVINLMARPGELLQGSVLLSSFIELGFKFGDMAIFHRYEELNGDGEEIFSIANMVKPGTFDPYQMEHFTTPGVSLFMQLPLRSNATFAFEYMLQAADQLAGDLDGILTDHQRTPLSEETIIRYRKELAQFEASRK